MANAGQAVVGVVGAGVGFLIGGPMGAIYGASIGLALGGILFPPKSETQGAAPSGLQVGTAQYGAAVPVLYGTRKVAGNLIWYGNFQTIAHEEEQDSGKGGGGGGSSVTTYTYSVSLAFALCLVPHAGNVLQCWSGKENVGLDKFTVYDGTQTSPDPHVASFVARWPSLYGLVYVVFPNYDLGTSPHIPNLTFEVASLGENRLILVNEYQFPDNHHDKSAGDSIAYFSGSPYVYGTTVDSISGHAHLSWFDKDTLALIDEVQIPDASSMASPIKMLNGFVYCTRGSDYWYQVDPSSKTVSERSISYGTNWLSSLDLDVRTEGPSDFAYILWAGDGMLPGRLSGIQKWNCTAGGKIGNIEWPVYRPTQLVLDDTYVYTAQGTSSQIEVHKLDYTLSEVGPTLIISISGSPNIVQMCMGGGYLYIVGYHCVFKIDPVTMTLVLGKTTGFSSYDMYDATYYNGSLFIASRNNPLVIGTVDLVIKVVGAYEYASPYGFGVTAADNFLYSAHWTSPYKLTKHAISGVYTEPVPTDVSLDMLTNTFYGLGLDAATYWDYVSAAETEKFCQINDLLVSLLFDHQQSILDAMQYVSQHHDGFFTYVDGKIAHKQNQFVATGATATDVLFDEKTSKSDNFGDGVIDPKWTKFGA